MGRYIADALLACHADAAIAQEFKGEYCAGVNAFDNQAPSELLNVSSIGRAGYADESACQALITEWRRPSPRMRHAPERLGSGGIRFCKSASEQQPPQSRASGKTIIAYLASGYGMKTGGAKIRVPRPMIGASLMNGASAARRIARFGLVRALLSAAAGVGIANAQTAVPMEAPAMLNAVDFNFVSQANPGAPFQVDSGRIAETKSTSAAIRSYAHLMVTSHVPVVDALNAILQRKNITPSNTLLPGAYDAMLFTLNADHGTAFDRNYVNGQVEYQKGNAALFQQEIQNGSDPGLKEFARQTLPKIEDHLQRALKLADAASGGSAD